MTTGSGSSFFKHQPPNIVAAHARSNCSECGSPDLVWMTPRELVDTVPADQKADAREGLSFFGPDADAWLCQACGHFGILSTGGDLF